MQQVVTLRVLSITVEADQNLAQEAAIDIHAQEARTDPVQGNVTVIVPDLVLRTDLVPGIALGIDHVIALETGLDHEIEVAASPNLQLVSDLRVALLKGMVMMSLRKWKQEVHDKHHTVRLPGRNAPQLQLRAPVLLRRPGLEALLQWLQMKLMNKLDSYFSLKYYM